MVVHAYYEKDARVRRYAEALVQAGHQVEVIALRNPGTKSRELLEGVQVLRVPLSRRRGGLGWYLLEYLLLFVMAGWSLAWRHLRRRYAVIHVHNMPDFLVLCALVPKLCGAKVILDVHDLMPEVFASKTGRSLQSRLIGVLKVQERLALRFADFVIFATEIFRDIAIARGSARRKRSAAVLNAADLRLFDRQRLPWTGPLEPGVFRVLYLGTISERHGVDLAVRAVARLRDAIPGLRFDIHPRFADGEGKPLQDLRALVQRKHLTDIVHFLDPVPLEKVPELMARANVGMFTPRVDVHIDIALSLKVPEYTAMQLPIVTTRTRIMACYFDESMAGFFDDGDVAGCARAIQQIHDDPEAARAMTERADRFLAEHSWDQERNRYFDLLSDLVPGTGPIRVPESIELPAGQGSSSMELAAYR
jgi:glycosyltransferase involved in cell wall biosynthesis